jgi:hypothetical protein
LIKLSRCFRPETSPAVPSTARLDEAYGLATKAAGKRTNQALDETQKSAADLANKEEERVKKLFEFRNKAARDRIDSCEAILRRLRASTERQVQQAVPLWEANLTRAKAELDVIRDDRDRSLREIAKSRTPTAEYELLNLARIELAVNEDRLRTGAG